MLPPPLPNYWGAWPPWPPLFLRLCTYASKVAWHTVFAVLSSNYKWGGTWSVYSDNREVWFSQTYISFSNSLFSVISGLLTLFSNFHTTFKILEILFRQIDRLWTAFSYERLLRKICQNYSKLNTLWLRKQNVLNCIEMDFKAMVHQNYTKWSIDLASKQTLVSDMITDIRMVLKITLPNLC